MSTMSFISYNVVKMVAIVHYYKLLQKKISQRLPGRKSLQEKKVVVSYDDLQSTERNTQLFFPQDVPRDSCLPKSEDLINKDLDDAASVMNLTAG
ncbi:hypothetical protein TNCV_1360821 [Trichonephila clavipes]|nr:hypothetical protein TNCV_1360821 [Trichonephila clavipes]